ncbi:RNA 2',3'-cyclic phosphodiesterase [Streptomyces sp. DT24]|uniref:RNA 2',3'-cyclic phosphodiesterase n=1 Tax=Streptomyces sp. DT24 TaxID=3416520 RepID=UPI003CF9FC91
MSPPRLFVAVLPPAHALDELRRAVAPLRALPGGDALRWTDAPGWHFTLAFLGGVDEELMTELYERLARAAHRTEPFPLRIGGSGRFDGRVLWAGAEGGLDTLGLLAARVDAAARRTGLPVEPGRSHTPHLTLARGRAPTDLRPYVTALGAFRGTPWQVTGISLVRSHPPVGGVPGARPAYEVVAGWPLGR